MNNCPQDMNTLGMASSDQADSGPVWSVRLARGILFILLLLEAALLIFGPHVSGHLPKINAALAAGKRPDWWDDAAIGIHYAALINAVLIVLLLITSKWWTRPTSPFSNLKSPISNPRWFWPLTIIAILACLGLRYPLASKSLWWDEAWVIQQASHGKWTPDKKHPGELKFQPHDWSRCAWYYQKPTNHAPMSLLQKASITMWQTFTGAKREQFSDLAARVPALLASCVAVGMMACLLRAWGRPGAGILAAFLLAMHPWAIRYGVDARAYALVIPLCISGMFAITRIVASRGGKTWPWVWWGVTEFLWLWAFPNAVIDITALNLLTAWLLWKGVGKKDRWTVMMRLVVTNVFAAMCFIQMFLPNVMQARRWAGQEADKHVLDWELAKSTLYQFTLGRELGWPPIPEASGLVSWNLSFGRSEGPVIFCLFWLAGWLARALRWNGAFPKPTIILPTLVLSAVAFAISTYFLQSYYYPRFVIGALPVMIVAWAVGAVPVGRRYEIEGPRLDWVQQVLTFVLVVPVCAFWLREGAHSFVTAPPETWSAYLVAASVVVGLLMVTARLRKAQIWFSFAVTFLFCSWVWIPQLRVLSARPYSPLHDVASFVQAQNSNAATKPLIACYGLGREVMPVYEPSCLPVENAAGVESLLQKAKAEERPLFLIYGYNTFNRSLLADGFKLLDDKALFEEVKAFPGIEPEFYFRVLKAK
jgi:hypothetical protein